MKTKRMRQSFNAIDKKTGIKPFPELDTRHLEYDAPLYENIPEMIEEPDSVQSGILYVVNKSIAKQLNSLTYRELKNGTADEIIQKMCSNFRLSEPERKKKTALQKATSIISKLCDEDKRKMAEHLSKVLGVPVEFADKTSYDEALGIPEEDSK